MVTFSNRKSLADKLKYYIDKITQNFRVSKIILFGSHAKGNPHEYSDIDIAVISPDLDKSNLRFENVRIIKEKSNLIDVGLQIVAYPTEVFENEQGAERLFIREIKNTGKIIYQS